MGKKLTKKEKDARKRARKRNARTGAKTSRGLHVGALPFLPHFVNKTVPAHLAALGITAGRVPVLSVLRDVHAVGNLYSLPISGKPSVQKRKHKEQIAKQVRLQGQLVKALAQMNVAGLAGKDTVSIAARINKLQQQVLIAAKQEAEIASLMRGYSRAEAAKLVRAGVTAAGLKAGMPKAQVKKVAAAAAASSGYGGGTAAEDEALRQAFAKTAADRRAAAASAAGTMGGSWDFSAAAKAAQAQADREHRAKYETEMLAANPTAWLQQGGKKRIKVDYTPVARGTAGAISIVVGPTAYKYATISPVPPKPRTSKVKPNGLYSVRKNMSKRSMKMNPLTADLAQLSKPILGAGAGFVASRALNALALMAVTSKAKPDTFLTNPVGQGLVRLGATGVGVVATLMYGDKVDMIRQNRESIVVGMALNALETSIRAFLGSKFDALKAGENPYVRDLALGDGYGYDYSHAGAPYSPMMGEYVSQSLNGFGEYVSQSLNGGMGGYVAQAAAGMGEYVSQSLNGLGYVDPSDQEGVDGMIDTAEGYAGLGTSVMAATAGLGTSVMAATAGLYGFGEYAAGDAQNEDRGIMTSRGIYNYFTNPQEANGGRLPSVSIEDAPMPVTNMGTAQPGAVPIGENVSTPEGRGYAGGIFGRHVFGTMI